MGKTTPVRIKDFKEIKDLTNNKGNLRIYHQDDYIVVCEDQKNENIPKDNWQEVLKIRVSTNSPDFITGMLSQFDFDIVLDKPVALTPTEIAAAKYAQSCGMDIIMRTPTGVFAALSKSANANSGIFTSMKGFELHCGGFEFLKTGDHITIEDALSMK